VLVQTINILIVNQSITDMSASFFTLLTAVVEVDGTRMSHDSTCDQFVCRIWLTRVPLWSFLVMSTYGILVTALERYIAVVYPIWYKVGTKTDLEQALVLGSRSYKNSSGDEIANVNLYAVRAEATRIR